jgi:hypothetical protein
MILGCASDLYVRATGVRRLFECSVSLTERAGGLGALLELATAARAAKAAGERAAALVALAAVTTVTGSPCPLRFPAFTGVRVPLG